MGPKTGPNVGNDFHFCQFLENSLFYWLNYHFYWFPSRKSGQLNLVI